MIADVARLVELFYSEHCPGCPEARQVLRRTAAAHPELVVVECNVHDDAGYRLATEYHLIATPAFVIDRRSVVYGVPRPETLEARLQASTLLSS